MHRSSRRRVAAVLTLAAVVTGACLPAKPPPGSPTGACRPDPFSADVVAVLDGFGAASHHLTVAVYDDRSGCWYHLRPGQRMTTASVVKVEIMAGTLLRAQQQGRGPTLSEHQRLVAMIGRSDDAAASSLWTALGGEPGMERMGSTFGLGATDEIAPTWGLTSTTAEDQARFLAALVHGPSPLDEASRTRAWGYLTDITPSQRWGVRAGVPPTWTVGHKNGFAGSRCCGWRVNSVGYAADPAGGGYSIAVLSDGWRTLAEGIPLVEGASRAVAAVLTSAPVVSEPGAVPAG